MVHTSGRSCLFRAWPFFNVLTDQLLDTGGFAAYLLKTGDDVGIRVVVQLDAQMAGVFGIPSSFCRGISY